MADVSDLVASLRASAWSVVMTYDNARALAASRNDRWYGVAEVETLRDRLEALDALLYPIQPPAEEPDG